MKILMEVKVKTIDGEIINVNLTDSDDCTFAGHLEYVLENMLPGDEIIHVKTNPHD